MRIGWAASLLCVGLLLFYADRAVGQKETLSNFSSQHLSFFTIADGLPSNETYDLEIDKHGGLWICTDNGVVRDDGISFQKILLPKVSSTVLGVEMGPGGFLL